MTTGYKLMEWTPERIARFWAWQAQYPEQYFTYLFGDTIVRHLAPWLAGKKRVLDYGCGTGFLIPHLAATAQAISGADLSPESVDATNACHGAIANFSGAFTIDTLRKRDDRFDAITIIEVVEHLDDSSLASVLDDVRTLLVPGGTAIFTTPNDENLESSYVYSPASDEVFHRYQHLRTWSIDTLPERLRRAGFTIGKTFVTDLSDQGWRRPHLALLRRFSSWRHGAPKPPHLVCIAHRPADAA